MLGDNEEIVEDWETEWVNDATGASQQVEWFVEDGDYSKESTSKVCPHLNFFSNASQAPLSSHYIPGVHCVHCLVLFLKNKLSLSILF